MPALPPDRAPPPDSAPPNGSAPQSDAPGAFRHPLRTGGLSHRKPTRFSLVPDAAARAGVAADLGLLALRALRFEGEIRPLGRHDFHLVARIEADCDQPCSVTLAPVPARIAEPVERRYLAEWTEPEGEEAEMPQDDTAEPLPEVIDLAAVAVEALALALPLYPRAPGAELGEAVFAGDGVAALRDDDLRPFAGLAALKARLVPPGEGDGGG
jgi:uncharacterized metal-binding protein YceD (DUF177 family)